MNNQAKDWQTGAYIVSVYNNRVKVSRPKQGRDKPFIEAEAKCNPEDEFSLSMGVALAMDRVNKQLSEANDKIIRAGDKAKIKDYGLSYLTYTDWIKKNIDSVGLAACFAYNQIPEADNTVYVVKAIAPWGTGHYTDKMLAYIQKYFVYSNGKISDNEACYLIEVDGLEKV